MYPYLNSLNPIVAYDVDRYRRLIESKGGQLGDGVISEAETAARLTGYVTAHYALLGRRDLWALMEAYQLGFGSRCYSFHGLEGALINGPQWGEHGIAFASINQRIDVPASLATSAVNKTGFAVARQTDDIGWGRLIDLQNNIAGSWNPILQVRSLGTSGFQARELCGGTASTNATIVKDDSFHVYSYGYSGGIMTAMMDGEAVGSSAGTAGITPPAGAATRRFFSEVVGVGSFAWVAPEGCTPSQQAALYNAFKSTIGKDLNLP